jgi:hypothetical protein
MHSIEVAWKTGIVDLLLPSVGGFVGKTLEEICSLVCTFTKQSIQRYTHSLMNL